MSLPTGNVSDMMKGAEREVDADGIGGGVVAVGETVGEGEGGPLGDDTLVWETEELSTLGKARRPWRQCFRFLLGRSARCWTPLRATSTLLKMSFSRRE